MAFSALLNVMVNSAMKAGRLLVRDFGEAQSLQTSLHGPEDFVKKTYHKAAQILHAELSKARPEYTFFIKNYLEETEKNNENIWIINAVDGKLDFLHGSPLFSLSIALERQNQIVAALIYHPAMGDLYTAEKGKGSFVNDRRLRVAGRSFLEDSLIGLKMPKRTSTHYQKHTQQVQKLMSCTNISLFHSSTFALSWFAAGRIDGYWEEDCEPSDIAAATLLIREAGGFVSEMNKNLSILEQKNQKILAGNQKILKALELFTSSSLQ